MYHHTIVIIIIDYYYHTIVVAVYGVAASICRCLAMYASLSSWRAAKITEDVVVA
jgi:predicted methyltransferase MtxX (methanogen marker protein 4)